MNSDHNPFYHFKEENYRGWRNSLTDHSEEEHEHSEDVHVWKQMFCKDEVIDEVDQLTEENEEEEEEEALPVFCESPSLFSTTTDLPSAIMYILRGRRDEEELRKVPRFVKKVTVEHRTDANMNGFLFSFEFSDNSNSPRFGVGFHGLQRDTFRSVHQGNELVVVSHRHTSRFSSDPVDLLDKLLLGAEVEEVVFEIPVSFSRLTNLSSLVHSITLNASFEGAQQAHLLLKIKGLKSIKIQAKWLDSPTVPRSLLEDRSLSALSSLSLNFQYAPAWIPLSHLHLSSLSFIFEKPSGHIPFVNKDKKVVLKSAVGNGCTTNDFITHMVAVIEKWIDDWFNDKRAIDSFLIKCSIYNFTRLRPKFIVRGINWKKGLGTVVRPKDGAILKIRFDVHEFKCYREK